MLYSFTIRTDGMEVQCFYLFPRLLKFKVKTDAVGHGFGRRRIGLEYPIAASGRHDNFIPCVRSTDGQCVVGNGLVAAVTQLFIGQFFALAADKASSVAVPVSVLATLTMPHAVDEARGSLWLWVLLTATLSLVSVRSADGLSYNPCIDF